jgi:hypothetical protein
MKSIFIFASLLITMTSFAQVKIELGKEISMELPQGSSKYVQSDSVKKYLELNGLPNMSTLLDRNTYDWNEVKFRFLIKQGPFPINYLEKVKANMTFLTHLSHAKPTNGEQVLKTINGNIFLCQILNKSSETITYCIQCLNKSQSKGFSLTIYCPSSMEKDVMAKTEEIMQSVMFKA